MTNTRAICHPSDQANHWRSDLLFPTLPLALLSLLWATVAAAQPTPHVVRQVSGCVQVRADHTTASDERACLTTGTPVMVVGTAPYWREITFDPNGTGWIAKKYIEPSAAPGRVPTVGAIPADAFLEVHFIDVAQGDAIWISTHDDGIDGNGRFEGRNIVIDGGPYSADNNNPVRIYMEANAHHGAILDALIVSHPHIDHYRGAENLSRHFVVRDYYDPGFPGTSSYDAFITALRGTPTTPRRAERLHLGRANFGTLDWGSELQATILYSDGDATNPLGSGSTRTNNASIVLRLVYGNHSFLFMGDAEGKDRNDPADTAQYVEQHLLANRAGQLASTVLKIAHHGSETSSTLPFIQAVDPDIVVVQSGRRSFSGTFIPDASTLERYCCHDPSTRIYRTDLGDEASGLTGRGAADGDHIVIRTNGTNLTVDALSGGQPHSINSCEPVCTP